MTGGNDSLRRRATAVKRFTADGPGGADASTAVKEALVDGSSPFVEAFVTWLVFSAGAAIVFYTVIPAL